MPLYFITGNKGKFEEVKALIPRVKQLDIDLPEIQDIDAKKIISEKLKAVLKYHQGEFFVEDTSLYFDCLNGLPGPLIKWFLETIGNEGLFSITDKFKNYRAVAKTIIGYAKDKANISFYEGVLKGSVTAPRGKSGFGWDPIFQPEGQEKTFAEMSQEEKNLLSMRKLAVLQLKQDL
ncbi:MAG TPA: non-canonical purine NTP pyrophosphatase [Candidatus Bathyarchaeia archaeon]|nr:non-canonical purine NTP pyrophosphatase [Candidatus Bathyarchaeia archaeon]